MPPSTSPKIGKYLMLSERGDAFWQATASFIAKMDEFIPKYEDWQLDRKKRQEKAIAKEKIILESSKDSIEAKSILKKQSSRSKSTRI